MKTTKSLILALAFFLILTASALGGALADRLFVFKPLDYLTERASSALTQPRLEQQLVTEESAVIDVAEKVSGSVVTVSIETPPRRVLQFNPFSGFTQRLEDGSPQDIGTGFIISGDGLIVTNKHVVSEEGATYKVITSDNSEYEVTQITRDPANDLAILKIDASGLSPVELGNSDELKVGQFVIAIGTALGEFRHTVTTGVISGLGRGITAGSVYEGYVERLDNVIQTDAAINPGNSGGPLLNSVGQVIGVNVAVAAEAENIGFAIPINLVKAGIDEFKATGHFAAQPYLGVGYQMISQRAALLNEVPQGAYVELVVEDSAAEAAGIQEGDIITEFNGEKVEGTEDGLAKLISKYQPGDQVSLKVWRDDKELTLTATLSESSE